MSHLGEKIAGTGLAIALLSGGVVAAYALRQDDQDGRKQALTEQARREIAGFVSIDQNSIDDINNHIGTGPLVIRYRAHGSLAICHAEFGYEGFLTARQKTDSDLGLKSIGDCPPAH